MELALGPKTTKSKFSIILCFNPCFRGTRSRTEMASFNVSFHVWFQSLFSWNSLSDAPRRWAVGHFRMFQSLFSWNSLSDPMNIIIRIPFERFNPCFRGTRSRTDMPVILPALIDPVSILVFVELALGLFHEWHLGPLIICFNPCFRGTRSRTACAVCLYSFVIVSILVFVELALGRKRPIPGCFPEWVSILVFVELALGRGRASGHQADCLSFNPCFRGTRSRTVTWVVCAA